MKPAKKYLLNPPFAMVVANPKRKRGRGRVIVARLPRKKNPAKPAAKKVAPLPPMKTKRRRRAKRRNPISNLGRFAPGRRAAAKRRRLGTNRKKRRNPARRSRRRATKIFIVNPMSKKTRRRGSRGRKRNPMRSRGSRRARRRSTGRRYNRNPLPIVRELFGSDMLSIGAGIVVAGVGTTMIVNRLVSANPGTGQRSFDLPFVDYSMLGNPATAATFYTKNVWPLAIYKLAIGGVLGYALRNQAPRFSRGVMLGTVATAISDVARGTGILNAQGQFTMLARAGTGRNFGAGSYLPGTNTLFTGPASGFLARSNLPRAGTGARVGPSTQAGLVAATEGAFRGAN